MAELPFVAAIRANPDDDTARLVAADWFEERGQAVRAEYIRVSVATTRRRAGGPAVWQQQRERAAVLFPRAGDPDGIPWGEDPGREVFPAVDRGFVDRVDCPGSLWVTFGDAICRREPIRHVGLTSRPDWDGDEDECWLTGDSVRVPWAELRAEEDGDYLPALLRHRWPGIEFDVPTYLFPLPALTLMFVYRGDRVPTPAMYDAIGSVDAVPFRGFEPGQLVLSRVSLVDEHRDLYTLQAEFHRREDMPGPAGEADFNQLFSEGREVPG